MADNNQKDANLAAEERPVPSQAEGEDENAPVRKGAGGIRPTPSQAEGDEATIDADLKRRAS
ncbi:MAG TPA: hypothetical protein VFA04_07010 [Bryobacteraceae bacterium]|jgi:hypothetical protein|nr:hypothetical protein [Bryobacteraceae bacterium]